MTDNSIDQKPETFSSKEMASRLEGAMEEARADRPSVEEE